MFAGFNREVRNSLRVAGLRIRYAVAVVELAVEQYGASVAQNIDLLLTARGTGLVRTSGALSIPVSNANALIFTGTTPNIAHTGVGQFRIVSGSAFEFSSGNLNLGGSGGSASNQTITVGTRISNNDAYHMILLGAPAWGSSVNRNGGDVRIVGGAPSGTGARGVVQLGWDGTNTSRVRVRNTILGINGYTSSAAAATTTELPTAGDYGIHKNTTSGAVHLCFNDAGTIRSVQLT